MPVVVRVCGEGSSGQFDAAMCSCTWIYETGCRYVRASMIITSMGSILSAMLHDSEAANV